MTKTVEAASEGAFFADLVAFLAAPFLLAALRLRVLGGVDFLLLFLATIFFSFVVEDTFPVMSDPVGLYPNTHPYKRSALRTLWEDPQKVRWRLFDTRN